MLLIAIVIEFNESLNDRKIPYKMACRNGLKINFKENPPVQPNLVGVRTLKDFPVSELIETIDWTPFFQTWELAGQYPRILQDDVVGEQARSLFEDAQAMLQKISSENWLSAAARYGIFPANRDGEFSKLKATVEDGRQMW